MDDESVLCMEYGLLALVALICISAAFLLFTRYRQKRRLAIEQTLTQPRTSVPEFVKVPIAGACGNLAPEEEVTDKVILKRVDHMITLSSFPGSVQRLEEIKIESGRVKTKRFSEAVAIQVEPHSQRTPARKSMHW
ncbi:hypothetical protein TYRP_019918 [Tyrophagus putrescentiae]|nr:hypothetical protein TYRP_019918 [Tyrophagus putrescentiae]